MTVAAIIATGLALWAEYRLRGVQRRLDRCQAELARADENNRRMLTFIQGEADD